MNASQTSHVSNPAAQASRPAPWLVADIGGSNARFALAHPGGALEHTRKLSVSDFPTPAHAVRAYLSEIGGDLPQGTPRPSHAAVAVATAVLGDEINLTNSHWQFSRNALQAELSLDTLLILNDFEALALSLPRLRPDQIQCWGDAQPQAHGTLAVIGPGTGLGVAGVARSRGEWVALPGEGGHATLAANDEFESAILAQVRRQFDHVSAERLLSGIGLPTLHQAVCAVLGQSPQAVETPDILQRGLQGSDPACHQTIETFCALLGSFAGNVALTLGARSGVYIGGGIVPRLGERFFQSRFRQRFEGKGRLRSYLEDTPTALITDTLAALDGAALALEQSLRPTAL